MDERTFDEIPARRLAMADRLARWGAGNDRRADLLEVRFLRLLRHATLVIAVVLLLVASVYLLLGLVRQIGSSEVDPEPVTVAQDRVAPATVEEAARSDTPIVSATPAALGTELRRRTLQTYKSRFAASERQGENPSDAAIIDRVWTDERRDAFDLLADAGLQDDEGEVLRGSETVALHAVSVVGAATTADGFKASLSAYREAREVRVCRDETRFRTRTVEYWDSYSTACHNWYYSPVGCAATRRVEEPYTVQQCDMQLPADLRSPVDQMADALDRYVMAANVDLEGAQIAAAERAVTINERKASARGQLATSGKVFLAFMGLMFLYILIAIERHHRVLRQMVRPDDRVADPPADPAAGE